MATTGQNIKRLRDDYEWSQEMLAEKLEIDQATLSLYENDKRRPKIAILRKLSLIFNVSVAEIDESLSDVSIIVNGANNGIAGHNSAVGAFIRGKNQTVSMVDSLLDEKAIRADERKRILDLIMKNKEIESPVKVVLYELINKED